MNDTRTNEEATDEKPAQLTEMERAEAELLELEAARAKRAEARALDQLKVRIANEKVIAHAEEEHGTLGSKIMAVEHDSGVVVVKRCNALIFKRFQDQGKTTSLELDKLVRPCLVHPDAEAFEAVLDAQPAVLARCANAIAHMAGARAGDVEKK